MKESFITFTKVPVIAVDGVDLAGKSSAIAFASDMLRSCGYKVLVIKRPDAEGAETIRAWARGEVGMAAARAAMMEDLRRCNSKINRLKTAEHRDGYHAVILDRDWTSAVVHQGEDFDEMRSLFGLRDHYIIFDVGTATAMKRARNRNQGEGLNEDPITHAATRTAFAAVAKLLPSVSVIDTTQHADPMISAREIAYWVARLSGDVAEVVEADFSV